MTPTHTSAESYTHWMANRMSWVWHRAKPYMPGVMQETWVTACGVIRDQQEALVTESKTLRHSYPCSRCQRILYGYQRPKTEIITSVEELERRLRLDDEGEEWQK